MSDEQDRVVMVSDVRALEARLGLLEKRITDEGAGLHKRISEEGETTRRHFDIVAESMAGTVKLVAELVAHHSTVLDNHETRLQIIEKNAST
jgi:hypothetical protein